MFSTYFYSGNLLWEKPGEIKDRKPQVLYRINTSVYTQLWIVPYGFSYMDLIPVHWYVRFIPHGSSPAELEFLSHDQRVTRIDALNIHINTNMTAGRATRSLKWSPQRKHTAKTGILHADLYCESAFFQEAEPG